MNISTLLIILLVLLIVIGLLFFFRKKNNSPSLTHSLSFTSVKGVNWSTIPNMIVMIRHGEKNDTNKSGCKPDADLNSDGLVRGVCLPSYFGFSTSNLSNTLFPSDMLSTDNCIIYAEGMDGKNCCGTTRPVYTIATVAQNLGFTAPTAKDTNGNIIPIGAILNSTNPVVCYISTNDSRFSSDYFKDNDSMMSLANFIKTDASHNGKNIIICWEHDALTQLCQNLFPKAPTFNYNDNQDPTKGKPDDSVFDRTWVFTSFTGNKANFGAYYSFTMNNGTCTPNSNMNSPSYTTSFDMN